MARKPMVARRPRAARKKPSFFTVLVEDDFSDQLKIPLAFYKHFYGKVPQQSLLRTPASNWNVKVKKVNDRFIFRKGWKKFVHDNGLKIGEFLVFHYTGNSKFDVQIFGTNSSERGSVMGVGQSDRPLDEEGHGNEIHRKCPRLKHFGRSTRHGKRIVDDQGGSSAAGTRRTRQVTSRIKQEVVLIDPETSESEECNSETSESQTSMHIDESETDQINEDSNIGLPSTDKPLDKASEFEAFESETSESEAESATLMHSLTASMGEATALERSNAFKSKNPSIRVPMHHSYIHGYYVPLSSEFVRKYLIKQSTDATLRVLDGRTWPVKFLNGRFVGGWKAFVKGNNLEVGDVCVFEMISKTKFILEVVILRKREAANCTLSQGK